MIESPQYRVLVVDDEANQRTALASMIQGWGYETATACNGEEALEVLQGFDAGAVVTDLMMPGMDGSELLTRLKAQGNAPPAIVLTAFGNLETAIGLVHDLGAFWFLEKPLQPDALRLLLERALAQRRLSDYNESLERQLSEKGVLGEMVGAAAPMQEVFSLIRQVAPTSATVLISGESGTGKELAARAVHALSPRRGGAFVAINCAALPESLIESELFGHEKGAFTGALERRRGCIELAHGGTLLLDEIGEMPLGTQSKLLRVIEERRVRRLGSPREVEVDVRVLAASNRVLPDEVRMGRFREDLFFRLNVFQLRMPPLRERLADIPLLCQTMIGDMSRRHQCSVSGVDQDAMGLLEEHHWPGNVRELRNVLERAVILAGTGLIGRPHLSGIAGGGLPRPGTGSRAASSELRLPVGTSVSEAERALIEITLKHTGNNRTRAAAILGISQKTLFNKLREYGSQEGGE
jgi:DNA-binding NtrC family response regulator